MFNVYQEDRTGKQTLLFSHTDRGTAESWLSANDPTDGIKTVAYVTSERKFKVGDVVRFADGFCSEAEKMLFLVIIEDRTNDISERYLVGTINHTNALGHSETVTADMIEAVNA